MEIRLCHKAFLYAERACLRSPTFSDTKCHRSWIEPTLKSADCKRCRLNTLLIYCAKMEVRLCRKVLKEHFQDLPFAVTENATNCKILLINYIANQIYHWVTAPWVRPEMEVRLWSKVFSYAEHLLSALTENAPDSQYCWLIILPFQYTADLLTAFWVRPEMEATIRPSGKIPWA